MRIAVGRDPAVLDELFCPARPARLRDVLARVHDKPVEPRGELRLPAELADALDELHKRLLCRVTGVFGVPENVQRDPLHSRRMPLTERRERQLISVFCASNKDWIGKPLINERPIRPQVTGDSTGTAGRRLHGPPTVMGWS